MKARVKPIMREPYMPKVREIDGTKHQMSRGDYRRYLMSTPQRRAEIMQRRGSTSGKNVKSIMENFKAVLEEHREINEPTTWDDVQKELFTDKEIEESESRARQMVTDIKEEK